MYCLEMCHRVSFILEVISCKFLEGKAEARCFSQSGCWFKKKKRKNINKWIAGSSLIHRLFSHPNHSRSTSRTTYQEQLWVQFLVKRHLEGVITWSQMFSLTSVMHFRQFTFTKVKKKKAHRCQRESCDECYQS